MKLYFHLVRVGEPWCEQCPRRDAGGFLLPPKGTIYRALLVKLKEWKHDPFTVVLRCRTHVPAGSWVEGEDRPTRVDDPEQERIAAYIGKQFLQGRMTVLKSPRVVSSPRRGDRNAYLNNRKDQPPAGERYA